MINLFISMRTDDKTGGHGAHQPGPAPPPGLATPPGHAPPPGLAPPLDNALPGPSHAPPSVNTLAPSKESSAGHSRQSHRFQHRQEPRFSSAAAAGDTTDTEEDTGDDDDTVGYEEPPLTMFLEEFYDKGCTDDITSRKREINTLKTW